MMPDISIITINYNNCEGLQKTMESVLAQSFTAYEYIIIDGGSTDGSNKYIEQHADKLSYSVSEKDEGVYDAMNKGICRASGKFIMFLNSGDYLVDDNTLMLAQKHVAKSNADIYYGNIRVEDRSHSTSSITYPSELTLHFWEHSTINHQASFIKAALYKKLEMYETEYTLAADYAFFLKCFFYGKTFEHINEALVNYRLDGKSSINNNVYISQMNAAWKKIIPAYLDTLYRENESHSLLMKHTLMKLAKNINHKYKGFKNIFHNDA